RLRIRLRLLARGRQMRGEMPCQRELHASDGDRHHKGAGRKSRTRGASRLDPDRMTEPTTMSIPPPRRDGCDRGFAMPTAIIILFIITLLLAAAVKVASQTSTSTTRDNNVKAEIEAAEGGLQVATYRLSQLEPKSTQCINGAEALTATTVSEAEAKCKSAVESLGNHATFQ